MGRLGWTVTLAAAVRGGRRIPAGSSKPYAMRSIVAVLILLVVAKFGAQYYLVASAKDEVIVEAFKARAANACDRASKLQRVDAPRVWSSAREVRLVIGKASLPVQLWEVDNALWKARFKHPYLHLTMAGKAHRLVCEFDIVQGAATIFLI